MLMTDPRPGKHQILFPLDHQCSLNTEGLERCLLKNLKYVHEAALWVCIYMCIHIKVQVIKNKKKKTYNSTQGTINAIY